MRSSSWHAHGNVYLVTEPCGLTPERVRELVGSADGILEVADDGDLVIWNSDGSQAEMSGNGTRIAARWLADRTGEEVVRIRVGDREVVARMLGGDEVEQDLGPVQVGAEESVDGIRFVPVDVGNPHAVVVGDPVDLPEIGPVLEMHSRFPARTNVQVARVDAPGEVTARVWERGVGETSASGTSAVAVAAATHGDGEVVVHFPGGDLHVRLEGSRAYLRGPAAPLEPDAAVDESSQTRHEDPRGGSLP
jgi:diaminopimelate epimerase